MSHEPSITLTLIPAEFGSDAKRDVFFDKMRTEFLAQSDQVVERIKKKCSASACDSQLKAAASAEAAKLADIETKCLLAKVNSDSSG